MEIAGKFNGKGIRLGIVVAHFNELITKSLLSGAIDTLLRHGVEANHIHTAWVPGSYEIPLIAQKMAESGRYDAVITLGALIRGATAHFDLIASQVASNLGHISLKTGKPVIFGVLTTDSIEQAMERAGTKHGNKGSEAALAALEMVDLIHQLKV
ncbi:6,7-dimethyl-8-ribityllumazine synthase [Parachlamydia sp. AcF125]|uniref:6,7-dimethyl-8-ribityllumazine synthase n=1 Tax=Parachlamydia sp. AcF125 TaxID=2795736 RepID=UPI001BC92CD8|nr:6,7-dimethyl-8-ribityllumazine synthase [Parachlamydia sp. AcF125]MBS4168441.1 6,7-dimethyl-8-ribityllumazine synthase [Parachlamydia sp. AcF125]